VAGLIAVNDKLYGTTYEGGRFMWGTVFELTPRCTCVRSERGDYPNFALSVIGNAIDGSASTQKFVFGCVAAIVISIAGFAFIKAG
jgi:hypothetical protein